MKKHLTEIINSNWFFVALVFFVIVLPFSQALVSIAGGILLFTSLFEDNLVNKINRFKKNRILLFIPAIFLIYLLSSLLSNHAENSVYDLKKNLFYLILPFAFLFGKSISESQRRYLFYVFSFSIVISTVVALFNWKLSVNTETFNVHKVSLVSHIRFSFQLILAFWFFILLIQKNYKNLNRIQIGIFLLVALYLISFLLFQQSLTGLFALAGSAIFFVLYLIFNINSKRKIYLLVIVIVLFAVPVIYVTQIINNFYDIEIVDKNTIDQKTTQGNNYNHNFEDPLVENGKYVYLYVCDSELREEWNKRSQIKYDSIGMNGFPVNSTLIRYLTSKGLRKDAEGVVALNEKDIRNVENGIANVIYVKKYSLYPRVYQTVWEFNIYTKTGNANQQSFSQRIEYAKAAITIIKQNVWFGVGTGNWKEEYKKVYDSNGTTLREEYYASAHNQYLNYMVKFGIVGFVVILFFLLYPVIKTKRYKDILFLLFLVFMFFANFADSNLESHMGSSFFVFFYCIFMVGGKNYLELPWRKQP